MARAKKSRHKKREFVTRSEFNKVLTAVLDLTNRVKSIAEKLDIDVDL